MDRETCTECGFDSNGWTDDAAVATISRLPALWTDAISGLTSEHANRRVIADMWSIAEYIDHVREVLFAMLFLIDSAVETPGLDLGPAPEPLFTAEPRAIDLSTAIAGLNRQADALAGRLDQLTDSEWEASAIVDADLVNVHGVARHAVHDATHHIQDVMLLRSALQVA